MDTVTQVLLGATIAEAGFRQRLGGRAVLVGGLCGLLPDLDFASRLAGPWAFLKHHRGETHSLLVLAVAAPLVGWLAWRWARPRGSPGQWVHLAFWALLTHPVLDWCTTYGTQMLWPITRRRFAIDAVAIIDPVYSLPLVLALVLACVPRVSGRLSRWVAIGALALTTAYLGFGVVQRERARSLGSAQLEREGFTAEEVRATPLPFTGLVWRITARDARRNLRVGVVSTWSPRQIRFHSLARPASPLVDRALGSERGRLFAWFAAGLVSARLEARGPHTAVVLEDQRYGMVLDPTRSPFAVVALFDADGRLLDVRQRHGPRGAELRKELAAAWRLLKGGP